MSAEIFPGSVAATVAGVDAAADFFEIIVFQIIAESLQKLRSESLDGAGAIGQRIVQIKQNRARREHFVQHIGCAGLSRTFRRRDVIDVNLPVKRG